MSIRAEWDSPRFVPRVRSEEESKVLQTETSYRFQNLMNNRMLTSFYRYGPLSMAYPEKVKALPNIAERVKKYEETGNVEWLIDAANFCMIEFMHPSLPNAHFRATDSNESPGRVVGDKLVPHDNVHLLTEGRTTLAEQKLP